MKAILTTKPGPKENLYIGEAELPKPKKDEILVKVHSFGLNRMDILQREGKYPVPKGASPIIGVEISGVITEVGSEVTDFKSGDRVCGLMPGGAYAEYAVIHHSLAFKLSDNVSFEQAAGFPEAYITAYQALHYIGKFKKGQSILIHAGASGVGTTLIQLAKRAGAEHIFFTAGTDDKVKFCTELGADIGINYKNEKFDEVILKNTDNKGVDLIIDFIGANYWNQNMASLKLDGKMVMLGLMSGFKVPEADIGSLLRKRVTVEGSTLRSRTVEYQASLCDLIKKDNIFKAVENGELKILVSKTFDWNSIQDAHDYMEKAQNIGKIIVTIS
ncbi:NADPH:quinone reductase-like protein [Neoconidiobolus thromboides FSU 785]|nr:NADPH:quinone reductase-like protein [Neoconidiobolus thromboides FSU 785]